MVMSLFSTEPVRVRTPPRNDGNDVARRSEFGFQRLNDVVRGSFHKVFDALRFQEERSSKSQVGGDAESKIVKHTLPLNHFQSLYTRADGMTDDSVLLAKLGTATGKIVNCVEICGEERLSRRVGGLDGNGMNSALPGSGKACPLNGKVGMSSRLEGEPQKCLISVRVKKKPGSWSRAFLRYFLRMKMVGRAGFEPA